MAERFISHYRTMYDVTPTGLRRAVTFRDYCIEAARRLRREADILVAAVAEFDAQNDGPVPAAPQTKE